MSITLTPVCDYCTAAATRVAIDATDELLCERCARQQYTDGGPSAWRAATRAITAADVRRYNDAIADVAAELLGDDEPTTCELFALCDRPAVGTVTLPYGVIPGCQRCADKLSLSFDGAAS